MFGFNIIESVWLTERKQWRFPRSKKRRIRKKWAKDEKNFKYEPKAYKVGGTLYCHPSLATKLREVFQ